MTEIICAAIAAIATITAAAVGYKTTRASKRTEARAERRARESRLAMELMYATCALSLTTARKLAGQHTNGDVAEAMLAAEKAQKAYIDFVRDEASHNFAKI